jgi:hypothetical protein
MVKKYLLFVKESENNIETYCFEYKVRNNLTSNFISLGEKCEYIVIDEFNNITKLNLNKDKIKRMYDIKIEDNNIHCDIFLSIDIEEISKCKNVEDNIYKLRITKYIVSILSDTALIDALVEIIKYSGSINIPVELKQLIIETL